jgi:hypothetical protein
MKTALKIVLGLVFLAIVIPSFFTFIAIVLVSFIALAIVVKIFGGKVNVNINVKDKKATSENKVTGWK